MEAPISSLTMVGDWRLDAVSSMLFLNHLPTYTAADRAVALDVLAPYVGEDFGRAIDLYERFFALYFAGWAKPGEPKLYAWCRKIILEAARSAE